MSAMIKFVFSLPISHTVIPVLLFTFLNLEIPFAFADTADYFYDDLGRSTRVVKGTSGVIYKYDELGNLVSVTSATTSGGAPTLTGINPTVLFVGSKMLVILTGQNLLTTETVTANGGLVAIGDIFITDTSIMAEMTAFSEGSETIKVTTRSGGVATVNATLSSSKLTISPGQLALAPGTSGTLTASITPPVTSMLAINLNSSAPAIASVPAMIIIPASGSASFTVNALQIGVAMIDAGDPRASVFVTSPFSGEVSGLRAGSVSVSIDAPPGTSPSSAKPVSVSIDASMGTSPSMANPVSVIVDAPSGTAPTISGGVSAIIQ